MQVTGLTPPLISQALCYHDAGVEVRDWSNLPAPLTLGVRGRSSGNAGGSGKRSKLATTAAAAFPPAGKLNRKP